MYELRDLHRGSYDNRSREPANIMSRPLPDPDHIHEYYQQPAYDIHHSSAPTSADDFLRQRRNTHPYPDAGSPREDSATDVGEGKVSTDISHGPWANIWSLAQAAKLQEQEMRTGHEADLVEADRGRNGASESSTRGISQSRHKEVPEDPVSLGWCSYDRGKELFDL
jgi:hypothetical protein